MQRTLQTTRVGVQFAICLVLAALGSSPAAHAQPGRHNEALSWDRNISGIVRKLCWDCHKADDPSGNVDLQADQDLRDIRNHRDKWMRVREVLESKQMPPEDARQLSSEQRELLLAFIDETFNQLDCTTADDPGPAVLRKLNRTEYDNVVQDLTGLDLRLAEAFPPEPVAFGFEGVGGSVSLSAMEVELYHTAARTIVAELKKTDARQPKSDSNVVAAPNHPDPKAALADRQAARVSLEAFAKRAFRRPADTYYINRLLRIYDAARDQSQDHATALGHCRTAILISPRFLFRHEENQPTQEAVFRVGEYELASRLSFFLWSRGPDDKLFAAAESGALLNASGQSQQVQRMLQDERALALVDNFFFQWLDLRQLESHTPDRLAFPDFDRELVDSMRSEARLTLWAIVRDELPITAILDAQRVYVDPRLAKHYGLAWPSPGDSTPQIINLAGDRRRGGLLSSAVVLMLQSDPNRTNIPRRGNFVLGQLLGTPPPPPPPDVPELEVVDDGKSRSLREIFELHRSSPDCQGCHLKIDPIGFALENFDAIGRWRERDGKAEIDPRGVMPSGESIEGIASLKDYLLSQEDKLLRTLASKLLIYALGRGPVASDECTIRRMVEAAQANQLRFSAMATALAESLPMTHRRNPEY